MKLNNFVMKILSRHLSAEVMYVMSTILDKISWLSLGRQDWLQWIAHYVRFKSIPHSYLNFNFQNTLTVLKTRKCITSCSFFKYF